MSGARGQGAVGMEDGGAHPLLSIIIPSFNQGAFIGESIRSCLEQDYRPIEILVQDNASTDGTRAVLEGFGACAELRWISEPDGGVAEAVNRGIARARGLLCGIQSADDRYLPGAFRQAVAAFRAHPDSALVYGDTVKIDAAGRECSRFRTGPFSICNFLSKRTLILQPAAFFRRDRFLAAGGWSADYFSADTECWLRMVARDPSYKINAYLAQRRMHAAQRDRQGVRILESYARMMTDHPILRSAPYAWRRAARCGLIRHGLRYGAPPTPAGLRAALWRAVRAWPPVLLDPEVAGLLLPGYHAIRRRLRRWGGGDGHD